MSVQPRLALLFLFENDFSPNFNTIELNSSFFLMIIIICLFIGVGMFFCKNYDNFLLQNIEFPKRGKLLFYSQIRKNYKLQVYLQNPINKSVHSKLTKLRIFPHPLEIEIG